MCTRGTWLPALAIYVKREQRERRESEKVFQLKLTHDHSEPGRCKVARDPSRTNHVKLTNTHRTRSFSSFDVEGNMVFSQERIGDASDVLRSSSVAEKKTFYIAGV